MKRQTFYILAALGGLLVVSTAILTACSKTAQHEPGPAISYYTCPMHHQIHMDHPGSCPICGMTLVPVYEGGSEKSPDTHSESAVRISPDRQQLIGLKTATAEKKPASKEIRTSGRVAFDPDLAVAEREYIEIARGVPALKDAARSNLRLKGVSEDEIRSLEKGRVGKNLLLPGPDDSVWVYATLYQDEMDLVKPGSEAIISLPGDAGASFTGKIRSVDPVVNPMTRSARARIEVEEAGGKLKPDAYVNVTLKIDLGEVLTVPKSAVIDTGTRKVAFVMTDGQTFQSRDVQTGPEAGEDIVVLSGLNAGDRVVSGAAFLVDSETHLKAADASPTQPTCPEGQYWDTGMAMCMPKAGS